MLLFSRERERKMRYNDNEYRMAAYEKERMARLHIWGMAMEMGDYGN